MTETFSMLVDMSCSSCSYHGEQEECEVCCGEVDYKERVNIPDEVVTEIIENHPSVKALNDLAKHMIIHSGYEDSGFMQMSSSQKELYSTIKSQEST